MHIQTIRSQSAGAIAHLWLVALLIAISTQTTLAETGAIRSSSKSSASEFVRLDGDRVDLILFPDAVFQGRINSRRAGPHGAEIVRGTLAAPQAGDFKLVLRNGLIVGVVRAGKSTYEISPGPHNAHTITQVDAASRFSCGGYLPPDAIPTTAADPSPSPLATSNGPVASPLPRGDHRGPPPLGCDDGTVIDLLVVYTDAARIAAGGQAAIEMRIASAADDTNDAFTNSLISCSVNVVHTQQVAYTETGDSTTDGVRLLDPDDGFLDDVHTLRNQHAADIAILWVASLETGGRVIARMEPSGDAGFHEMRQDNWAGFTMAHELGHNLGCAHDRPNAFPDNYFSYSYGYHQPAAPFHDIMAVAPPATPMIPYFANPNVSYLGHPTGVPIGQPDEADCATTINQTKLIVANYRVAPVAGQPAVLFVSTAAAPGGNGQSWATAFNDLQHAICQARRSGGAVKQIWVRGGFYYADLGSDLEQMAFYPQNGLAIYGGFAGTETMLSQRNPAFIFTYLSGDIGGGASADNTNNIVMARTGVNTTAILDGFTIVNGHADTANEYFKDSGGGVRCDGGSPTIANCRIFSNYARNGAGMAVYNGAAPTVFGCTFDDNSADALGGGMHIDASSPVVSSCAFLNNSATDGGAVQNDNGNGSFTLTDFGPDNTASNVGGAVHNASGSPTYSYCSFTGNYSPWGGAMRNAGGSPTISMCDFADNSAGSGGGVVNDGGSPLFDRCTFSNNVSDFGGGAIATLSASTSATINECAFTINLAAFGGALYISDGDGTRVTGCDFIGNSTDDAGAVYLYGSAGPTFDDCLFSSNTAGTVPSGVGGAVMGVFGSHPLLSRCTFLENQSGGAGGAISLYDSPATLVNCGFFGNITDWSGGAVDNVNSAVIYSGCIFSGNRANSSSAGGIMISGATSPRLANCTFSRNHAGFAGGGIAVDTATPQIANCVLWGNTAPNGTTESQQLQLYSGGATIRYTSLQGWSGSLGGTANNGANPLLADSDGADNLLGTVDDNLRLTGGSGAIDSGDDFAVEADFADLDSDTNAAERHPLDMQEHDRFVDHAGTANTGVADPPTYPAMVDRGAYEFASAFACGTCPGDLNASLGRNARDIQQFVNCLLAGPGVTVGCACADMNANGAVDLSDVTSFVNAALATTACP